MSKTTKLLICSAAIIVATTLVGLDSQFTAYAFKGFHQDTAEPCFMSDPFCTGEDDSNGTITNCKSCKEAGGSTVCDFDSTSNVADCITDIDSEGRVSCEPGPTRCR